MKKAMLVLSHIATMTFWKLGHFARKSETDRFFHPPSSAVNPWSITILSIAGC
jgi:hypothetical protein